MLDIAITTGVFDDPGINAERARLVRARRRADRSFCLAWGGFIGALIFVALVGWYA